MYNNSFNNCHLNFATVVFADDNPEAPLASILVRILVPPVWT